jgi:hypothetical protein
MTSMHDQKTNTINVAETLSNFYACVTCFIGVMEQENTHIKEHDTTSLTELLSLKKEYGDRYEKLMGDINVLLSEKALSKDERMNLSRVNQEFIQKTKENYFYLENSHEYSHRLMNVFFASLNQVNKYSYTEKGETKFIRSSNPIALSQTF